MVQTKKLATCSPPLSNTRSRETLFPARRQAARAQRRLSSGFSQRSDHSKSISNRLQLWHYYHQWMENTHSVRAAVDGDPRLSSLTHSDRDVALWVGEPHVDHWNISIRGGLWKALLRNPKLCIYAFNPLSLCDKPFSWSSPCPSQMHIQLLMTSIGIHFNNVRW